MSTVTAPDLVSPFAWSTDREGIAVSTEPSALTRRRVTQCALSRICGVCAEPLGRPIAFLGSPEEVARNAFHAPPLHLTCATGLLPLVEGWQLVTTSGFEFVRPNRGDLDPLPTFLPNSIL